MIKNIALCSLAFMAFLDFQPPLVPGNGGTSKTVAAKSDTFQVNFIENSWSAAIRKASAEKKLIFVDAYAVWCAPCRQLKATTFKDKIAAEFFNRNFVNLSLDMEKGEGVKLAEKWQVDEFPTLLILDYQGNVITGNVGFLGAGDLIRLGERGLAKRKAGR